MNATGQLIPEGYQESEIGVIPDEWEVVKLPDVAWFQEGPGLRNWQFTKKGLKVINVTNLQESGTLNLDRTDRHITWDECEKTYKHFLCDAGDLVIASSGNSYCKSSIVREEDLPLLMNTSVIRFKAKVDIEYLFMTVYLRSKFFKEQIDLMITGGAQPNFGPFHLNNVLIPLPSAKKEQTAIAKALSDVDALLAELEKLIAKKQAIKTATMQQLLTGKTRLPEFAYYKDGDKQGQPIGTKQSELGKIPKDWDVLPLSKMLKDNPKYGINSAAVPLRGNLPVYIRITDISEDGYFKPSEMVGVNSPFSNAYQLKTGDIVLARTGASVGKSYLYNDSDGKLVYAGFLIKVSSNEDKLKPDYLFQYLKTEQYWSWVTVNSMRSGQPGINGNEYGQLPILIPSIEEQTTITTILSHMDNEIQTIEKRLAKTRQINQGMMQELLTGRTRLPVVCKEA